jgi:8-oxo-dGTP pyrophosphatase MutT (NUDIX family)
MLSKYYTNMPHIHEKYDFTVSAMIMHHSEPKLGLHFHKKLRKWLQAGGHIELHEDPLQALEHELLE